VLTQRGSKIFAGNIPEKHATVDKYRFKFGEVHVQAYVFSGLSDSGRIRTTTNNSLRVKTDEQFLLQYRILGQL